MRQRQISSGLISEKFPQVKKIQLEVEFHNATGRRVQRRVRDLSGDSYAMFDMGCPLDDVPFDLKSMVSRMVSDGKKQLTGTVKCSGSEEDCGHFVNYKVKIQYVRKRVS